MGFNSAFKGLMLYLNLCLTYINFLTSTLILSVIYICFKFVFILICIFMLEMILLICASTSKKFIFPSVPAYDF